MKNQKLLEQLIKKGRKEGATQVFADFDGCETQRAFAYPGNRKEYKASLVLDFDDRLEIFAAEPRYSKAVLSENLSKWILFSSEAKKSNGKFYLIVPAKLEKDFRFCLEKWSIAGELIVES